MPYLLKIQRRVEMDILDIYPSISILEEIEPGNLSRRPEPMVDEENNILYNHRTYQAYRNAGAETILVTVVEGLEECQKIALVARDRIPHSGTIDQALLDKDRD
jgi:hypothetical protein